MPRFVFGLALALSALPATAHAQQAPLKMVVTIKPVHALALQVLDGVATPTLVVDNASPHTYALKPSDAKLFNDADVVVRVSESLEPFTSKVVRSLPKTVEVVTLASAKGITTLPRRTSSTFEKDDHAHDKAKGHSHGPMPGAKAGASIDGHLWLSPANGKAIVLDLARVASAKRPADAARIAANAAAATARLDVLDAELAKQMTAVKAKPYIVFHDAYQYFETHYGLTPAGSITVDPDVPASAKRLSDIRNKVKRLGATCVFSEPGYETKVVQSVIEGTAAKTAALDPEALTITAGVDAYDALMRKLAAGFQTCLAPPS